MNNNIVRRIDELGRIVIPKDFRKKLNISDGEDLEFGISDGLLTLKRHSSLANMARKMDSLLLLLERYLKYKVVVTDRSNIVASSYKSEVKELKSNIIEYIKDREHNFSKESYSLALTESLTISGYINYAPIIKDSNVIGMLFFVSEMNLSMTENIIKMVSELLASYFEV